MFFVGPSDCDEYDAIDLGLDVVCNVMIQRQQVASRSYQRSS
jgi:hypothetical protein